MPSRARREEWELGRNIAEDAALVNIADRCGLDPELVLVASKDSANIERLEVNAREADERGVIGVPTFMIDDEIFWGQDRVEFVIEKLTGLRAKKF